MAPHAPQPVSKPRPQGPAKGCGNTMQRIGLVAPAPQPPAHRLCPHSVQIYVFEWRGKGPISTNISRQIAYRIVGPGDGGDDCAEALLAMMATMATVAIMAMPRW